MKLLQYDFTRLSRTDVVKMNPLLQSGLILVRDKNPKAEYRRLHVLTTRTHLRRGLMTIFGGHRVPAELKTVYGDDVRNHLEVYYVCLNGERAVSNQDLKDAKLRLESSLLYTSGNEIPSDPEPVEGPEIALLRSTTRPRMTQKDYWDRDNTMACEHFFDKVSVKALAEKYNISQMRTRDILSLYDHKLSSHLIKTMDLRRFANWR